MTFADLLVVVGLSLTRGNEMLRRVVLVLAGCLLVSPAALAVEDQFFDSKGVKIRYTEQGQGEPVVLIHAFSANIELMWVATGFMKSLVNDYRVIALDNRGAGKSGKPHDPKQYGREMAEDVVRLLDHLKIKKAHVVGYSSGGAITLRLLCTHPDRLLSATVGGAGLSSPADIGFLLKYADSIEQGKGIDPNVAARNDMKALAAMLRGLKELVVSGEELRAKAVNVPTLALVGGKDPVQAAAADMKGRIANFKMVVIDGADHFTTPRRPEFLRSLQEFLKANAKGK